MKRHAGASRSLNSLALGTLAAFAALFSPPVSYSAERLNNVVVVLDASGSMAEPMANGQTKKMDAAKEALREVLASASQDMQIGLLVFGAENVADGYVGGSSYGWAYRLGPRNDRRLIQAINSPIPKFKTPLGACIEKASAVLTKQKAKQKGNGSYRLLIVTDGQADDPDVVERVFPQAVNNGIVVDVIGVAMKETHLLATKAHRYYSAENPAALKQAIAKVFAEVGATGSDGSGTSAFDEIAPIPDKVAAALIDALVKQNQAPSQTGIPPAKR